MTGSGGVEAKTTNWLELLSEGGRAVEKGREEEEEEEIGTNIMEMNIHSSSLAANDSKKLN